MMIMTSISILPCVKVPMLKMKGVRCSVSAAPPPRLQIKPSPAEVSRTIMELSSVGTFSTAAQDVCPLALGVRFAVDPQGTPILSLNNSSSYQQQHNLPSSLNVQLEQCGLRTTQCTIQGTLHRPHDHQTLFQSLWEKRFGEKADPDFIHILHVQRVLQMDNFMEDGVWVTCSDYRLATADPLRDFAQHLVHEINTHNMEDVLRFCNIFVDSDVQVSEAKMVWLDRLGFDIHLYSPQHDVFEVRIPFPREVTNEKAAKSSFNEHFKQMLHHHSTMQPCMLENHDPIVVPETLLVCYFLHAFRDIGTNMSDEPIWCWNRADPYRLPSTIMIVL